MRVNNGEGSFNMVFAGESYFCIFENISWLREYLIYLAIIFYKPQEKRC